MKYAVITFGCRVNQADSLGFEEELRAAGATAVAAGRRGPRDREHLLGDGDGRSGRAPDDPPGGAGQPRREDRRDRLLRDPAAGRTCRAAERRSRGPQRRQAARVIPLVLRCDAASTAARFGDGDGSCGAAIEPGVAGRTAFTLRVQTGCAEPCSYCIIPTTRGAPRSVPVDDVLREVERVTAAGFKEVALTGVHLGSYGRDLESPSSLIELLRALDGLDERRATLSGSPSDVLFRISSLEPMDCSAEIVDLVARSERFAPHFHLPLQHASNRVLAAMRRPYTIAQYSALVDDIRAKMPGASIGSDIIVGFPARPTTTSSSWPRISSGRR